MPPKRRVTAIRGAGNQPRSQQSTLSFHGKNKVTKPSSPRTSKETKKDPARVEDFISAKAQDVKTEAESDLTEQTTSEKTIQQQPESEAGHLNIVESDPLEAGSKLEDVLGGRAKSSDIGATGGKSGSGWIGDEEAQARKITDGQVKKYWRGKEQERKAPRIHQQDLSLHEKILREWDMSGQFGPCIGIARLKRWKRANMMGLKPPIEVLAVLLKEINMGETKSQRAHVDELMSLHFEADH